MYSSNQPVPNQNERQRDKERGARPNLTEMMQFVPHCSPLQLRCVPPGHPPCCFFNIYISFPYSGGSYSKHKEILMKGYKFKDPNRKKRAAKKKKK